MYALSLYQLKKNKKWKWVLAASNGIPVCRAENSYDDRDQAETSFTMFQKVLGRKPVAINLVDGKTSKFLYYSKVSTECSCNA